MSSLSLDRDDENPRRARILLVDDDVDLLLALEVQLGSMYDVTTAQSASKGLASIAENDRFAVVISDMEMPDVNGIAFLKQVRQLAPESVLAMMTAHSDIGVAIRAVNDGQVFRFLLKPFRGQELVTVIDQCVDQFRLVIAERELLETTLISSIQLLIDILALTNPLGFGRANRIRCYTRQLAEILKIEPIWEIELAGLLCQVGCITIPPTTLARALSGDELSHDESQCYLKLTDTSARLIDHIPRLERVARIIARSQAPSSQNPENCKSTYESFETAAADILRASITFDTQISRGATKSRAVAELKREGGQLSPTVLAAFSAIDSISTDRRMTVVKSNELNGTMIVRENLYAKNGHLIVGKGQQVTKSMRELIRSYVQRGIVDDAIGVYLPADSKIMKASEMIPMPLAHRKI